ncbi:MAG: oligosaccharide flippase family protein [Burkholderiaceae bacterium]|nr:oligosaccharide flippase family protein [Burkholderiaceae bacterium]
MGSAAWSAAGKLFQFLVGLIALAVIARWVGPEAYGVFALSWVVVGFAGIVVSAAPTDTLVQRRDLHAGHCNASLLASLAMALAAWLLIAAGADALAAWLGGGAALAMILPVRAASLPLSALASVPTALLMREQRFKVLAGADAVAGVLGALVGIGAAIAGAGLWSLVAMELVRQAVLTLLLFRVAAWRPGLRFRRADAADLVAFNVVTWGAWGLDYADEQLPRILIAASLGTEALGFFALAERLLGQASSVLLVPAYQVLMPGLARVQTDREAARQLADSILRGAAVIAGPVFLGLAAIAGPLVPLVFGVDWAGAVPVVQVLMLLGIWSSLAMAQTAVVRGMGRPGWHLAAAALQLCLTATLTLVALPHGLLAVTAALVAVSCVMLVPYARFVQRLTGLGITRQVAAIAGPTAAALTMAACTLGFVMLAGAWMPAAVLLALAVALGAAIYLAALLLFAPAAASFVMAALCALMRGDLRGLRTLLAGAGAPDRLEQGGIRTS